MVENNSKMSHSPIFLNIFMYHFFFQFHLQNNGTKAQKKNNKWETFGNFQTCVRNVSVRPLKLQQRRKLRSFFCSLLELNKIFPRSTICPVAKVNFLCCT